MTGLVKSAQRVVEIFEYFAARRSPATLTQICTALNYPASSTFGLLRTLQELGYLDYARDSRTFIPTVRAALLGIWVNDAMLADGTITRLMYRLSDETGSVAVLAIQSQLQVQYISVVRGNDPTYPYIAPGALRPLLRSAMGRVILSLKSKGELRALVSRINAQEPASLHVGLSDLTARLEAVRQRGWDFSEGVSTPGFGIITMLLAAPRHQPPMVLGLAGRISVLQENRMRYVEALRTVVDLHRRHMENLPETFRAYR